MKPDGKLFLKRNLTRPFENQSSVEFLCTQNDTALFAFGSHSKKRPHNLILGRIFDGQVLDMIEFGIDGNTFRDMTALQKERTANVRVGGKPCFIFVGDEFDNNTDMAMAKNLLLDWFRGEPLEKVNLAGLDRVIVCTAVSGKIFFRHYALQLKKSGTRLPRVELQEVGPTLDLTVRRTKSATEDVRKQAMRVAKSDPKRPPKEKNIHRSVLGDREGEIHMKHQELNKVVLSRGLSALQDNRKKRKQRSDNAIGVGDAVGNADEATESGARRRARPVSVNLPASNKRVRINGTR